MVGEKLEIFSRFYTFSSHETFIIVAVSRSQRANAYAPRVLCRTDYGTATSIIPYAMPPRITAQALKFRICQRN